MCFQPTNLTVVTLQLFLWMSRPVWTGGGVCIHHAAYRQTSSFTEDCVCMWHLPDGSTMTADACWEGSCSQCCRLCCCVKSGTVPHSAELPGDGRWSWSRSTTPCTIISTLKGGTDSWPEYEYHTTPPFWLLLIIDKLKGRGGGGGAADHLYPSHLLSLCTRHHRHNQPDPATPPSGDFMWLFLWVDWTTWQQKGREGGVIWKRLFFLLSLCATAVYAGFGARLAL